MSLIYLLLNIHSYQNDNKIVVKMITLMFVYCTKAEYRVIVTFFYCGITIAFLWES